jgi:methylenetetrahydrofolate reductase (NADPH)
MKITERFPLEPRTFSFEFFPPKTPEAVEGLFRTAERLRRLAPTFVSVTRTGTSTHQNTIDITARFQAELGLTGMAHLTCVGSSRDELVRILEEIRRRGIENLMLLRGDPPAGESRFVPAPGGFANADALIRLARSVGDFSIGCAGYPEGHPECVDKAADLEHLKIKVDGGADFVVTQLFFENRDYFDFVVRARRIGIEVPIIPGIMPALSWPQIQRMASRCGSAIPASLARDLQVAGDDPERSRRVGVEWAKRQCEELLRQGAPGIHFYTLNQSRATEEIFAHLREADASLLPAAARAR